MIWLRDTEQLIFKIYDAATNTNEEAIAPSVLIGLASRQSLLIYSSMPGNFSDFRNCSGNVDLLDHLQFFLARRYTLPIQEYPEISVKGEARTHNPA